MHNYTNSIQFVIFSKIQDAGTSQELSEVVSAEDLQSQIIEAGFTKPVFSLSLSDKGEILHPLFINDTPALTASTMTMKTYYNSVYNIMQTQLKKERMDLAPGDHRNLVLSFHSFFFHLCQ